MKIYFQYVVYDQHGAHGSGGWSRNAKHKPLPRVVEGWCEMEKFPSTTKVTLNGVNRMKCNLLDGHGHRRVDYPDIVPKWWSDPIAIATKIAEADRAMLIAANENPRPNTDENTQRHS